MTSDIRLMPPLNAVCGSCPHSYMGHVSLEFVNKSLRCLSGGCPCPRFEWAAGDKSRVMALEGEIRLDELPALVRHLGLKELRIEFDTDYGIDKKTGWSVTMDGAVVIQFAPTPEIALRNAVSKALTQMEVGW